MHGNAGNKFEGESYVPIVLPNGMDLFAFDFSGCGNSQGDFVTLGWKEQEDLKAVLQHLSDQGNTSGVALWGRSMGGATALLYDGSASPIPVKALVIDSSFSNFAEVAQHTITSSMNAPPQLFQMFWPMVVQAINEKTGGLNLETLKPVDSCPSRTTAVLFLHAIDDQLIPMDHSQQNHDAYGGEHKEIAFFEGDHNSERPEETM